jgi:hypothetical protein
VVCPAHFFGDPGRAAHGVAGAVEVVAGDVIAASAILGRNLVSKVTKPVSS